MDPVEIILQEISKLDLKPLLAYLASKGIVDFTAKGYDKIKEMIRVKNDVKKYWFVPDKQQAERLRELGKNPGYQTVKSLIPEYPYIDVIRTGLLIKQYYDSGDDEAGGKIKHEIIGRPNGRKLISIVHLTCSEYFSVVINYLIQLKTEKGYSEKQLLDKFDEIINEWGETHLAVKSTYHKRTIMNFCIERMKKKRRNIFLLGIKKAAETIEIAIEELEKEKKFKKYGYEPLMMVRKMGKVPKVEAVLQYRSEIDKFMEDQGCDE